MVLMLRSAGVVYDIENILDTQIQLHLTREGPRGGPVHDRIVLEHERVQVVFVLIADKPCLH